MTNRVLTDFTVELEGRDFGSFHADVLSLESIEKWLAQTDWSADAKGLLLRLATTTVKIGTTLVAIGRKVIQTVLAVAKFFPQTTFGIVIGSVLSLLVGSIPIVGFIVGPLLSPILLIFGIGGGALADFRRMHFEAKVKLILAEYKALQP